MSVSTENEEDARVPLWNDPRVRGLVSQFLLIAFIVWFGYAMYSNYATNIAKQNIATGFGFLDTTAGFAISQTLIQYSEESSYGRAFLVGLMNTLLVSFVGVILATTLGVMIGVARLSKNWIVAKFATVYVETLRNIPLLLQIYFWYVAVLGVLPSPRNAATLFDSFFLHTRGLSMPKPAFSNVTGGLIVIGAFIVGIVISVMIKKWAQKRQEATGEQFPVFLTSLGIIFGLTIIVYFLSGSPIYLEHTALKGFNFRGGMTLIPEFMALLMALVLYTATFIAEIVRAGIMAVSHGQTEAANALGLRSGPTLRLVIIPQAMRVIIPPLTSQYLNLTKNSSLAAAIAYPDVMHTFAGIVLNQTGQAVEIILVTMAVYLTISLLTSSLMNWYNARIALVER